MWTTLNFGGNSKKKSENICKGTPDIEFEQDWSVGLGAILADGQKIKNYFSSYKDFFHIVGVRMYNKPTKYDQIGLSHFWENRNFKSFIMWTTRAIFFSRSDGSRN